MPLVWQIDRSYNLPNITGQVRWNGATKSFEVDTSSYSGDVGNWQRIDNTVELQSNHEWEAIFKWAKEKMAEEERIAKLVKEYAAIKDAKEKLDILMALVRENTNT